MLSGSFSSRALVQKGCDGTHSHTSKWHDCWDKVKASGKDPDATAAICTSSIGPSGSMCATAKKLDRVPLALKDDSPSCPHCGSKRYGLMPPDFETAKCHDCGKNWDHGIVEGINNPTTKADAVTVLKYNPNHGPDGRFAPGAGNGSAFSLSERQKRKNYEIMHGTKGLQALDITQARAAHPSLGSMHYQKTTQGGKEYFRLMINGRSGSMTDAKHAQQTIEYWKTKGWTK